MKKKIDWVTAAAVLVFIVVGVAIYLIADYHGPGIVSKWVKQLSHPADEVQEEEQLPVLPEKRLVVNPNFDGTNDEYIFVEAVDDEGVVTEIRKITKYRYYSDNGDAIAETTIHAYDGSKVLSANSNREQVKNPDTLVARKEVIYTYFYSDEKIDCTITVTSYLADGTVASADVRESERLR